MFLLFRMIIALFIMAPPAYADDLDDGAAICNRPENQIVPRIGTGPNGQLVGVPMAGLTTFKPGWEHCPAILNAWSARKEAADALDETKNPDLKKTRDLAKTLKK